MLVSSLLRYSPAREFPGRDSPTRASVSASRTLSTASQPCYLSPSSTLPNQRLSRQAPLQRPRVPPPFLCLPVKVCLVSLSLSPPLHHLLVPISPAADWGSCSLHQIPAPPMSLLSSFFCPHLLTPNPSPPVLCLSALQAPAAVDSSPCSLASWPLLGPPHALLPPF